MNEMQEYRMKQDYIVTLEKLIDLKDKEIKKLHKKIDKANKKVYMLLDAYDRSVWEDIAYVDLADFWSEMIIKTAKEYEKVDYKGIEKERKELLKEFLFESKRGKK